jgi:hypothetical protein
MLSFNVRLSRRGSVMCVFIFIIIWSTWVFSLSIITISRPPIFRRRPSILRNRPSIPRCISC